MFDFTSAQREPAKAISVRSPRDRRETFTFAANFVFILRFPFRSGCVTGLLKVGVKNLYVFDANGESLPVAAPCVLDFYVHESRQRAGLGKELFEHMLERENFIPRKLAIDRPSDKLIAFLQKHYGKYELI